MIHDIINPSDPYTIEATDMEVLTAAIFLLGGGHFATQSTETDFSVPITVLGGMNGEQFFQKEFNKDLSTFMQDNLLAIAACLNTICLGDESDRDMYFSGLESSSSEKEKQDFIENWYNERQTSMNGIGQRAAHIVCTLENIQKEKDALDE